MAASYAEVVQACSEFQENFSILNAKFNALTEELSHERERNERAQKAITELEKKDEHKSKIIADLQEQLDQANGFRNKYLEATITIESMKSKLEIAKRGIDDNAAEHLQKIEQLNAQLEDMQKRLSTAGNTTRVQELQKQVQELEERCALQNGALSEVREQSGQKILSAHTALREQQSKNLELEQRLRAMETDMNDMRSALRRSVALQNEAALLKERLESDSGASKLCVEDLRREVREYRLKMEKMREEHERNAEVACRAAEEDKRVLVDRVATLTSNYNRTIAELSHEKDRVAEVQRDAERRVQLAREEGLTEISALRRGMGLLKEEIQRDKLELRQLQEDVEAARRATANEEERNAILQQEHQQLMIQLDSAVQQEAWATSEKRHTEERLAVLQRHADDLAETAKGRENCEVELERLRMMVKFREDEVHELHRLNQQLESKLHDVEKASSEKIHSAKREARHFRKQLKTEEAKSDSLRQKLLRALVDKEQELSMGKVVAAHYESAANILPHLPAAPLHGNGCDVIDLLRSQSERAAKLNERLTQL